MIFQKKGEIEKEREREREREKNSVINAGVIMYGEKSVSYVIGEVC